MRKVKHGEDEWLGLSCGVFEWESGVWTQAVCCLVGLLVPDALPSFWGVKPTHHEYVPLQFLISEYGRNTVKVGPWVPVTLTSTEITCGVQFWERGFKPQAHRGERALTADTSFSCPHQSVCMCSPASGTTALITACTEVTAKKLSGKACLSCTGTEASTMTISNPLSKRSMKQYGM